MTAASSSSASSATRTPRSSRSWKKALAETGWTKLDAQFDAGKGKLALFDSAYSLADADEHLKVALAPGKHTIETRTAKGKDVEVELVRLRTIA